MDQPAEAERWLRRAVSLDPGDYTAQFALARSLRQQGKESEAIAVEQHLKVIEADMRRIRKIIREDINRAPNDPALRTEIGNILLRAGSDQEGVQWLYSALSRNPTYVPAHRALLAHFQRKGESQRAAPHRRFLEGTSVSNTGKKP
jgi:predicted Zn-dependent protease